MKNEESILQLHHNETIPFVSKKIVTLFFIRASQKHNSRLTVGKLLKAEFWVNRYLQHDQKNFKEFEYASQNDRFKSK